MRTLLLITALLMLVGCARPERPAPTSYGPPTMFSGPDGQPAGFRGMNSWGATDEHYGPATPGPFKGY